jgi:hypothetical protein
MAANREPSPTDWTGLSRVVRPTLIAAIGGTGASAAKAALARIRELVGERHHYIAARAFDTAFQDNRAPRLVDGTEYVYLGGFNAQSVIADIVHGRAFPHWASWLPPRLNFQQVAFGAGGIRPIGRLCYFYRRDRVEAAIQDAITAITDSDKALRFFQQTGTRVNLESGIDIHLVASVCGGTGSGMFLDFAFDLRRWAEAHTNREVTVTGHLVLPEAFRGKPVVMKALEANAFTALVELDRCMNASSNQPWEVEYVQNRPEISWRAPFDHCYMLSGLQQGGTADIETLSAVAGETIALLALSQSGQKISEGVINMAGQRKSTRDKQGKVCCYSSYGVLGVEMPDALLGEALGPLLARHLHELLLGDSPPVTADDLLSFKERLRITDFSRVEDEVPRVEPDLNTATLLSLRHQAAANSELQQRLVEARERTRRERRQAGLADLWDARELRTFLDDHISSTLAAPGGLAHNLAFLERSIEVLRDFQRQIRERAREAENEAAKLQAAAYALERSDLSGRSWSELTGKDLEAWRKQLHQEATAAVYQDQPGRIERLVTIVQQEFVAPWKRIKEVLGNLEFAAPLDEDAYYRAHRARASAGPVRWFHEVLRNNMPRLEKAILEQLVDDAGTWATLEPKELNARFYAVCSEAIRQFFASEPEMTCDRQLARCYGHPGERYKTAVAVLLDRAKANWEMHESYDLRDNKLEISSVGVRVESPLFDAMQEGHRAIQPVDEQREDYIPILRTEHGLSLAGLKSLDAYRRSLRASIFEEQRFDFHFFNDRRAVTRVESAVEEEPELRQLYVWSAAVHLDLVKRVKGKGYQLAGGDQRILGDYRRAAYLHAVADEALFKDTASAVDAKNLADPEAWAGAMALHIGKLEQELERAADPKKVASEQYLSLDIYQLHAEIRGIKHELRVEDLGL